MKKIKSICIDTVTTIQENEWMTDRKKPNHDKWKDYGQGIFTFHLKLQALGFETVLVIGQPGTGKSSGMRTLETETNIWFNCDNKNPVWRGGREEYGRKVSPKTPLHVIPKTYDEVTAYIKSGLDSDMFEEYRIAFLIGHPETYKEGIDTKSRLKTLGNMATTMQLEGRMENVFYANVKMENNKPQYVLQTQNNGYNTVRSPQDLFDLEIENDYGLIYDKLSTY
ncbi:hypothetical protein N9933_01055 [bacterium]|nr:hypothetical protein [bacterium]